MSVGRGVRTSLDEMSVNRFPSSVVEFSNQSNESLHRQQLSEQDSLASSSMPFRYGSMVVNNGGNMIPVVPACNCCSNVCQGSNEKSSSENSTVIHNFQQSRQVSRYAEKYDEMYNGIDPPSKTAVQSHPLMFLPLAQDPLLSGEFPSSSLKARVILLLEREKEVVRRERLQCIAERALMDDAVVMQKRAQAVAVCAREIQRQIQTNPIIGAGMELLLAESSSKNNNSNINQTESRDSFSDSSERLPPLHSEQPEFAQGSTIFNPGMFPHAERPGVQFQHLVQDAVAKDLDESEVWLQALCTDHSSLSETLDHVEQAYAGNRVLELTGALRWALCEIYRRDQSVFDSTAASNKALFAEMDTVVGAPTVNLQPLVNILLSGSTKVGSKNTKTINNNESQWMVPPLPLPLPQNPLKVSSEYTSYSAYLHSIYEHCMMKHDEERSSTVNLNSSNDSNVADMLYNLGGLLAAHVSEENQRIQEFLTKLGPSANTSTNKTITQPLNEVVLSTPNKLIANTDKIKELVHVVNSICSVIENQSLLDGGNSVSSKSNNQDILSGIKTRLNIMDSSLCVEYLKNVQSSVLEELEHASESSIVTSNHDLSAHNVASLAYTSPAPVLKYLLEKGVPLGGQEDPEIDHSASDKLLVLQKEQQQMSSNSKPSQDVRNNSDQKDEAELMLARSVDNNPQHQQSDTLLSPTPLQSSSYQTKLPTPATTVPPLHTSSAATTPIVHTQTTPRLKPHPQPFTPPKPIMSLPSSNNGLHSMRSSSPRKAPRGSMSLRAAGIATMTGLKSVKPAAKSGLESIRLPRQSIIAKQTNNTQADDSFQFPSGGQWMYTDD